MHIFYYLLKIWKLWWHIAGVCLSLLPSARASTPPLAIALNTVASLPPQVGSRPIWALEIFMFWFLDLNLSQSQEDYKGSRNVHDGHEEPPTIKMAQVTEEVQIWKRLQKVFSQPHYYRWANKGEVSQTLNRTKTGSSDAWRGSCTSHWVATRTCKLANVTMKPWSVSRPLNGPQL